MWSAWSHYFLCSKDSFFLCLNDFSSYSFLILKFHSYLKERIHKKRLFVFSFLLSVLDPWELDAIHLFQSRTTTHCSCLSQSFPFQFFLFFFFWFCSQMSSSSFSFYRYFFITQLYCDLIKKKATEEKEVKFKRQRQICKISIIFSYLEQSRSLKETSNCAKKQMAWKR